MRRRRTPSRGRPARHGRHGRLGRSSVVCPPLPPLESRQEKFDLIVGSTAEFLRATWEELRDVSFDVAVLPSHAREDGIARWLVDHEERRIVLYRLPIERLGRLHRPDELHRRMRVESAVFCAAAEYLDRDPWDLGHERFRFL